MISFLDKALLGSYGGHDISVAQDVAAVLLIIVQLPPQKEVSVVGSVCAWCVGGHPLQ